MFTVQRFYPVENSAVLAVPFYALNPPLFGDYQREIKQQWRGYVGIAPNGALLDKSWGKAGVVLTFGKLTRDEFAYLVTLKGVGTLYCRNEDTNTFQNHNAILAAVTAASFSKSGNMYESVTATFRHLVQL